MAALKSAATIPPGGDGTIEAQVSIFDSRGEFSHTVTVETSDPQRQTVKLGVKGKVLVDARFEPRRIDLGPIVLGDTASTTTKLETDMPEKVRLTKVVVAGNPPNTHAEIVREKGAPAVQVRFESDKIGLVEHKLEVHTTAERRPTVEIEVVGHVVNLWEVTPRTLSLPESEDGGEPRSTIELTARKRTKYRVTKAIDPTGAVETQLAKRGDHFTIDLKLIHPVKAWRGRIEITTDDPDQPSISVRYFVQKGRHVKSADRPEKLRIKTPPASE